jgi:hypothetical protein
MSPSERPAWRKDLADRAGLSELVPHDGHVGPDVIGRRIGTWLESRGFETDVIASTPACIVKAHAPEGWKKTIGASPSLEVEVRSVAAGTEVVVHPGRAGGATWTARYLTYSWVAFGVSYAALKRDLLGFVRQEVQHGQGVTSNPQILDIVETTRSQLGLGRDERTVDNALSDTTVTRSIKLTKRWTQSCTVEIEKSRVTGQSGELTIPELATLKSNMEQTLRSQYASSTEEEQIFEEVVTLEVPPRSSLHFAMEWKRIIQNGYVRVQDSAGQTIEVPFAMAVGLTFDQRQVDAGK